MDYDVIVIGAGPGGLTAAYELARLGQRALVIEQAAQVGGISRTECYRGFRFDIGGHRFFTRVSEIEQLWRETLGDDLLTVQRQSRIYYRGRFFKYPIALGDALLKLGLYESVCIMGSYLWAKISPHRHEDTFEQWVSNRFGRRLYETFFKTYTEKVWGLPCSSISADWAAQRIKGLSLSSTILNALTGASGAKTLISSFLYPRLGPGMMWEALAERAQMLGATLQLDTRAVAVRLDDPSLVRVEIETPVGRRTLTAAQVISSAPLSELTHMLQPAPPAAISAAADRLRYRDFVLVLLLVQAPALFTDQWLYVHSPNVRVGRIQNSRNWSADLTPDPAITSLGMEYFSTVGDDLWQLEDAALVALASAELATLGLAARSQVLDGTVVRQRRAYPVYDDDYEDAVAQLHAYFVTLPRLQTVGRNGMHRYNNLDHSMLTGLLAARNVLGAQHDLWQVNADRSYLEAPASP